MRSFSEPERKVLLRPQAFADNPSREAEFMASIEVPMLPSWLLNDRGDCSSDPRYTIDHDDRVIFEGQRLDGDLDHLALAFGHGMSYVSRAVDELLPLPEAGELALDLDIHRGALQDPPPR